jgi:hypothetical protein
MRRAWRQVMSRGRRRMGVSATGGALLLLASCRPAAASLELAPGAGAASTANAILATPLRSDDASRVRLLRTANRLPKVAFPRLRADCLTQVLGPTYARHLLLHARVETMAQLRDGAPNPWEVAWVIWQYEDDTRFYYFIPKPNGWELGKRDPSYPGGQRFLASGTTERFPIGRVHDVTIVQDDDRIAVFVDGREIVRTRDVEKPYRRGRIGIYAEDAAIKVHAVRAL